MRGSVGAGGGGSRRLPGAPHAIAGSHPRRDVPPRRDRPRPTWRSIPVQVRRAYYHCADCGHGVVPRDDELGVAGSSLSPGLATMVDRAGAAAPFAKASSLLGDLAGIALTTKRCRRSGNSQFPGRSVVHVFPRWLALVVRLFYLICGGVASGGGLMTYGAGGRGVRRWA